MMTQSIRERAMYDQGVKDALALRTEAASLTGTEIIDREHSAPAFDPQKDYSTWPVGGPVTDEGQVWTLIQPHNAANYTGRPSTLRALWGLTHTTDPKKAKAWVDPYGTSGMYMTGECYKAEDGTVWRCLLDGVVYSAAVRPDYWEVAD